MPLRSDPLGRFCIFGDSHLASVKLALDAGLIDLRGLEMEFFGAGGPWFRGLRHKPGRVVADRSSYELLHLLNGGIRNELLAEDFGHYLFYGARLRLNELFQPILARLNEGGQYLSRDLCEKMVNHWLTSTRSYRIACDFAAHGANVYVAPAPFLTDGILSDATMGQDRHAVDASYEYAERLWALIMKRTKDDGVIFLRQPQETVTRTCLTLAEFACANAKEDQDAIHKSPEFTARIVNSVVAQIAESIVGRQRLVVGG